MERLDRLGPRLVEGGRGPARIARPAWAGTRSRRRRPRTHRCRGARERLRHGWLARDRARDRAALRPRRRRADRDRLSPQRPRGRGGGRRSCARRAPSRCSCAATSRPSRVLDEVAALGPLDVLVHNAATGVVRAALDTTDKHWDWTLNANARALLQLARVAVPQMPAGSSIVAISSLGAQRVLENYSLIGTSKAALESLVRYLAVELAPRGHPGQRRLGRRRRDGRARLLPEPRGDARGRRREPRRPPRRPGRHRRRGRVPLLGRRRDGARPDARRRRRLLAHRVARGPPVSGEPTPRNRGTHRGACSARPEPKPAQPRPPASESMSLPDTGGIAPPCEARSTRTTAKRRIRCLVRSEIRTSAHSRRGSNYRCLAPGFGPRGQLAACGRTSRFD